MPPEVQPLALTVDARTPGTAIFSSSLAAGLAAGAPGSAEFTAAFGGKATALVGQAGFVAATGALPTPANAPILQANGGPNALSVMGHQVSKLGDFSFHPQNSESNSKTSGASIGLRGAFEAIDRVMSFDVSLSHSKNETYWEELSVNRVALELAQNGLDGPNCVPNGVDNYDVNADAQDVIGGGVFGGPVSFLFTNPAPRYVLNMRKNISLALTSTNQDVGDCQFLNPYLTKETSLPNDPAAYATVGVQRSPTGDLQVVNFNSINAGGIETSGVDITANYTIDASYGTWNWA
jgi:hypothetical protein